MSEQRLLGSALLLGEGSLQRSLSLSAYNLFQMSRNRLWLKLGSSGKTTWRAGDDPP